MGQMLPVSWISDSLIGVWVLPAFVSPHLFSSLSMLHVGLPCRGYNDTTFTTVTDTCMSCRSCMVEPPATLLVGLATNIGGLRKFCLLFGFFVKGRCCLLYSHGETHL
ncbi:uncharacterized protein CC84DRAFT_91990 [Paraphaeosphaeria sporulosa]|uniref:Uncharacterized protein n=1 Tax=Paraphaeosphaeria sporulosa TaxID=1460663 RepID=A0A177CZ98_9PLEO|nr:uncharacterized protein CC84DRAFT_91990 [Paraphaeosphaeria sporulosa]OAG12242.1 hypothetical protein CC84DRAFT_91990 [Paraphaeosphaeria sporulosa]